MAQADFRPKPNKEFLAENGVLCLFGKQQPWHQTEDTHQEVWHDKVFVPNQTGKSRSMAGEAPAAVI